MPRGPRAPCGPIAVGRGVRGRRHQPAVAERHELAGDDQRGLGLRGRDRIEQAALDQVDRPRRPIGDGRPEDVGVAAVEQRTEARGTAPPPVWRAGRGSPITAPATVAGRDSVRSTTRSPRRVASGCSSRSCASVVPSSSTTRPCADAVPCSTSTWSPRGAPARRRRGGAPRPGGRTSAAAARPRASYRGRCRCARRRPGRRRRGRRRPPRRRRGRASGAIARVRRHAAAAGSRGRRRRSSRPTACRSRRCRCRAARTRGRRAGACRPEVRRDARRARRTPQRGDAARRARCRCGADTSTISAPASRVAASASAASSRARSAPSSSTRSRLVSATTPCATPSRSRIGEVLARLRHDAFVGGDEQQGDVDAARAGDHVADEALVAGHVDDRQLVPVGQVEQAKPSSIESCRAPSPPRRRSVSMPVRARINADLPWSTWPAVPSVVAASCAGGAHRAPRRRRRRRR